jgi:hypothetical protein
MSAGTSSARAWSFLAFAGDDVPRDEGGDHGRPEHRDQLDYHQREADAGVTEVVGQWTTRRSLRQFEHRIDDRPDRGGGESQVGSAPSQELEQLAAIRDIYPADHPATPSGARR